MVNLIQYNRIVKVAHSKVILNCYDASIYALTIEKNNCNYRGKSDLKRNLHTKQIKTWKNTLYEDMRCILTCSRTS